MSNADRAGKNTKSRLRLVLTAAALILAGLVFVEPMKPVIAQAIDPPSATITGVVFQDKNGNGAQEDGEPGVEGVSVSDGVTIVETGPEGRYRLETDTERRVTDLVYITQPAGYAVGADEYMTPRFYRDLGRLQDEQQAQANFALAPDPESRSDNFTFGNVADPHRNANMKTQMAEISSTGQDLAFVQVSGDLTDNATDAEFQTYRAGTAESDVPVWPAVGNHEYFNGNGSEYRNRIENYRRYVGPEWYSFDRGERHFIVLENNGAAPFDEQLEWVRQDLEANAAGKRVVVLMHQPMNVPFGSPSTYDRYEEIFEQYETELVLVGHEHSNDTDAEWVEGARHVQTNSSSYTIDHSPRGFRYVRMRGERFENPFRMYGAEKTLTITNPAPGEEVPARAFDEVQVNAYDTSDEVRRVRYRLDNGNWRGMKSSGEFTWFAGRAATPAGRHTIEVEALDAAGERWTESETFTVTNEAPVVPQAGADWAQHHGDERHSGVSADVVEPGLNLAWSHRTPGTFLTGSPVISDGVVYAATRDENGEGNSAVYAVDQRTGERLWEFETETSVHGSIAVSDGVVYAHDLRSNLYAIDAEDGEQLWQREPGAAPEPNNQRTYGYYGVTVADGKVFWTHQDRFGSGSQGSISALDPKTGQTIWESSMTGATMSDGTPVFAAGKVYVGNQTADRILAYDAATGRQLWTAASRLGGWQDGIPTVAEGRVFIGSNNAVIARDANTGQDLWTHRSPGASYIPNNATPSTAAVADGTLYMGFPDGRVTALDAATGQVVWSRQLPGRPYFGGNHSSPAISGETLYIGSNNGSFYAIDRLTGQQLWSYETGTWMAAGPAVSGNTVVAGAWDGNLYAFTPGGEAEARWPRASGTVTDPASGEPVPGAKVVASRGGADDVVTSTDDRGRYVLGLEPGSYTVSASKRGYLTGEGSQGSVEMAGSEDETLDLRLTEVTGPVAGTSRTTPDFGGGSTRLDVQPGDTYHYAMNDRVQATISSREGQNNQPGTFQRGWLSDLALLDNNAQETLDWSELILSEGMNDPARPWGRGGEWLSLPNVSAQGDTVTASGNAQVDQSLKTSVSYRALPDSPVVKATLEIENTGARNFDGHFQYLLDPDSSDDTAYVPGVSGTNRGFLTSGWTGNYVYVGPKAQQQSPAHAIAWAEDEPTGVSAFGYVTGAWFDASVPAGGKRTISWYHITDYPAAGDPTANVARWASQIDTLDDEVADRSRAAGTVTKGDTGEPAGGVLVEAIKDGATAGAARTGPDGEYAMALEPGTYTLRAATLGYDAATRTIEVRRGEASGADLTLGPVTAAAGTGKQVPGGLAEGGPRDVVIENGELAMAISKVFDDPQLSGSTVGKPVDLAMRGREDQIDWFNLPYISRAQPQGTEAWQQRTVRNEEVEVVREGGGQAIVRASGASVEEPGIGVVTTYTVRPDEEWVTAETVFTNRGPSPQSVWVGDAIDHDGAGQRSGVAGNGVIATPYSEPAAYEPSEPWIGVTGNDPQTYGLIYAEENRNFAAYGNGNWIMSQRRVEIPAGESHTMTRRIVAAPSQGYDDPFGVLAELYAR